MKTKPVKNLSLSVQAGELLARWEREKKFKHMQFCYSYKAEEILESGKKQKVNMGLVTLVISATTLTLTLKQYINLLQLTNKPSHDQLSLFPAYMK